MFVMRMLHLQTDLALRLVVHKKLAASLQVLHCCLQPVLVVIDGQSAAEYSPLPAAVAAVLSELPLPELLRNLLFAF